MKALVLGVLVLLLAGCSVRQTNAEEARIVVAQFLAARQARNLDATLECFVDQPELRTSTGVGWNGHDAVRAIMAYRIADSYTVGDLRVSGNRVSWTEHVTPAASGTRQITGTGGPPAAFDEDVEATVVDGRIATLMTYIGGARQASDGATRASSPANDLFVPTCVLLLVAGAVLVWPPAPSVQRSLGGHALMNGLREYVARRS